MESAGAADRRGEAGAPGGQVELALPVRGMTCQSCVHHVRSALQGVPGVKSAQVELAAGLARINLDPAQATVAMLQEAIEAVGYVVGDPVDASGDSPTSAGADGEISAKRPRPSLRRPALLGLLATSALLAFYVGIVSLAQGFEHAAELLLGDWYLVLPIVVGFGVQVGLFVYLRRLVHGQGTRSATALAGAGTGTSSISMVACCAHHLADLLPVIGVSGAALFLNDYRQPLMLLGIATNLVGIAITARMIRRMRGRFQGAIDCHQPSA